MNSSGPITAKPQRQQPGAAFRPPPKPQIAFSILRTQVLLSYLMGPLVAVPSTFQQKDLPWRGENVFFVSWALNDPKWSMKGYLSHNMTAPLEKTRIQ